MVKKVEKIPCNKCGKEILQNTYDKTGGFCMPCYREVEPNWIEELRNKSEAKKNPDSPKEIRFINNENGTVFDQKTGHTWMRSHFKEKMNWNNAFTFLKNYDFAGFSDWRLPSKSELKEIIRVAKIESLGAKDIKKISDWFNNNGFCDITCDSLNCYFWTSDESSSDIAFHIDLVGDAIDNYKTAEFLIWPVRK